MRSRLIGAPRFYMRSFSGRCICAPLRRNIFVEAHHPQRTFATGRPVPKVLETSVWTSIIPKFIRNRDWQSEKLQKSKQYNPATFFIFIFLLIGSQAIRMITLKNDFANYTRSTDAKIRLLKEVIEKVQKGEDVDVKKLLGTGDEAKEREWEEVLREIEQEDSLWHSPAKKESSKAPAESKDNATKFASETESGKRPESAAGTDRPTKPRQPFQFY